MCGDVAFEEHLRSYSMDRVTNVEVNHSACVTEVIEWMERFGNLERVGYEYRKIKYKSCQCWMIPHIYAALHVLS